MRNSSLAALFCLAFVCPAPAQELLRPKLDAKLIESSFTADWYGVYLGGKKIGYFTAKRQAEGKDKVRDSFLMNMKIASFGKKVEMTLTQDLIFESEAPYRVLKGEFKQMSDVTTTTIVEKADKGYVVTVISGKTESKKKLPELDYTLADAMASEVWLRGEPKEGDTIVHRDFSMDDLKVETQTSKLLAKKATKVGGREVPFYEVETVSERQKKNKMKTVHDDLGRLLSGNIAIFELRREPEEQAKNTEFSADLFVLGQVKVDRKLGNTDTREELILEASGKGAEFIPPGPWQSVEEKDGKRILKLGKKHGKMDKATEKEIKEALDETIALPITHPKIVALAKEAVGEGKTPQEKVKALVEFTYKFIRPSLSTTLPEIHHLLERKTGDCKCYARLFCVLARANGIPCREVSGFVYMGDRSKAFGGHAWNEVALDGVWVPLDASMNRTEATVGHIYLGGERDAAGILETLGTLSFRVIEEK